MAYSPKIALNFAEILLLAYFSVFSFLSFEKNEILAIKSLDHFFSVLLILSGG